MTFNLFICAKSTECLKEEEYLFNSFFSNIDIRYEPILKLLQEPYQAEIIACQKKLHKITAAFLLPFQLLNFYIQNHILIYLVNLKM